MEELVKYIVSNLIEDSESVKVTRQDDTITICAEKKDIGKIIGKQGRIAKSIRTILKASSKDSSKINLDIIEA